MRVMLYQLVILSACWKNDEKDHKKAEHGRIEAFDCVQKKTLESPFDSKEIKSVNPKGTQPWI